MSVCTGLVFEFVFINFNNLLIVFKYLTVGTGSNACYVEKTANAEMFDGESTKDDVLINTEWGAFGDNGALDFVRTEYDREVDSSSINPGKQM